MYNTLLVYFILLLLYTIVVYCCCCILLLYTVVVVVVVYCCCILLYTVVVVYCCCILLLFTVVVYYRSIDVSNATFSYSVDNLFKHQFEVTTPGCTYFFQANSQEAMFQWINALQVSVHVHIKTINNYIR